MTVLVKSLLLGFAAVSAGGALVGSGYLQSIRNGLSSKKLEESNSSLGGDGSSEDTGRGDKQQNIDLKNNSHENNGVQVRSSVDGSTTQSDSSEGRNTSSQQPASNQSGQENSHSPTNTKKYFFRRWRLLLSSLDNIN